MRLPSRSMFKDYIESNGGTVTKLDTQAHYVIADHARKDSPVGSISWKWIEDSVKKGSLEDFDKYPAGPAKQEVRPAASGQPTRKGRTKYTAEDDRILMEWCIRAERRGVLLGGNPIWHDLEKKYPRHSWQSWKDHWAKIVSKRPRPEIPEDDEDEEEEVEEEEEEEEERQPLTASPRPMKPQNQRPVQRPAPRPSLRPAPASTAPANARKTNTSRLPAIVAAASPVDSERSHTSSVSKSLEARPYLMKSDGGDVFTEEETARLSDAYEAILNLSEDKVIDAWIAWSVENPNHTPQEWRNYFQEHVVREKEAAIRRSENKPVDDSNPSEASRPENILQPKTKAAKAIHPEVILPVRPSIPEQLLPSNLTSQERGATELQDSQGSSGQTVAFPTAKNNSSPYQMTLEEFEEKLKTLADKLEVQVNFLPTICGRQISLFKLWQIVTSDELGGYDTVTGLQNWWEVANKLGFFRSDNHMAASNLKDCYGDILVDFENIMRDYGNQEFSSSQDDELIDQQLRGTFPQINESDREEDVLKEHGDHAELSEDEGRDEELQEEYEHDDDLEYPQSSPPRPKIPPSSNCKRRFESDPQSQRLRHNKRQRIDKGKEQEIPSTPEDVINNNQTGHTSHQPSPLKVVDVPSDSDDSSIENVQPIRLPRQKPPQQASALEPETQDFHFSQSPPLFLPGLQEVLVDEEEEEGNNDADVIPRYVQRPASFEDSDEDEEIILVRESSPLAPRRSPERRTISTTTTRGTYHSSSNNYESSTQSQNESQIAAEFVSFIDEQVSNGYAYEHVLEALTVTCFGLKEALVAMESLANDDGIPENTPGIWTKWDDEALGKAKSSADWQRIVRKHGISRIVKRKKHLHDIERADKEG
ncbi:uncharacterized protein L3040_005446 [Drepanopeziza brunnea f. sp. 'multigermtubi']|uniref:uncharacterized protein n=1 Tax=Drepanopeziza brunnea f. sp. 'multigermtubi' TaxID=698441 RepID=UPI0023979E4C|nr:hypothetical protein L3040_005446 [Drepanopeziza brunnea f. sp. 'multigermtubi']